MLNTHRRPLVAGLALAAGFAVLFAGEAPSVPGGFALVSKAEAVIGRPLTPMSYAGVARRTTARAYAAPVVVAPVVVAPRPVVVAPRPGCWQAVDAYGRVYWRCP